MLWPRDHIGYIYIHNYIIYIYIYETWGFFKLAPPPKWIVFGNGNWRVPNFQKHTCWLQASLHPAPDPSDFVHPSTTLQPRCWWRWLRTGCACQAFQRPCVEQGH
jgi:hypothetical protein